MGKSRWIGGLALVLVGCSQPAVNTSTGETANEPGERAYTLSQVVQDRLVGLMEAETPESRAALLKEVRACLEGRRCAEDIDRQSPRVPTEKPARRKTANRTRKQKQAFERAVAAGDLEAIEKLSPGFDLGGILRTIGSLDRMRLLSDKSLEKSGCAHAPLLLGLGGTAEQFLPDQEAYELATKLYARAFDCGADAGVSEGAARAGFRLGLLFVMHERYRDAEGIFSRLLENPASVDFASRIAYWRWYLAQKLGNRSLASEMKTRLEDSYPLSLHTLFVSDKGVRAAGERLSEVDPRVRFRSRRLPEANQRVRLAEALQWEGADSQVGSVLDPVMAAFREQKIVEPDFQLYVAVLLMRSGENIRKFQWVSGLFRDRPSLISRTTLQLVYPLKRFEMIRGLASEVQDPYLTLSLIRQESGFNERARSRVGARGLMQLMPATARLMERGSTGKLYDPEVNVRLGVKYLNGLLGKFSGDAELSLAAYNAGPDRVDNWLRRYPVENRLLFLDLIPFRETREYVASIARNYYWYLRLYDVRKFNEGVIPRDTDAGRGIFPVFGQSPLTAAIRQASPNAGKP